MLRMLRNVRSSGPNNLISINTLILYPLRFYASKYGSNTAVLEEWLQTLSDIDRRKIRYFQNEVNF